MNRFTHSHTLRSLVSSPYFEHGTLGRDLSFGSSWEPFLLGGFFKLHAKHLAIQMLFTRWNAIVRRFGEQWALLRPRLEFRRRRRPELAGLKGISILIPTTRAL